MRYKLIEISSGDDLQIGNYTNDLTGLATASANVRSDLWIIEGFNKVESLDVLSSQYNENTEDTELSRLLVRLGYDRLDGIVKASRPLESTLSSILLGKQYRISSGGENVFFTNGTSKINYFPSWSGMRDMNILSNRTVADGILPFTGREYLMPFFEAPLNGPPDPSVIVENQNTALVGDNTSGVAIEFILGEVVVPTDVLRYKFWFGTDDSGIQAYEQAKTGLTLGIGDTFEWVLDHPIEILAGTDIFARVEIFPNGGTVSTTLLSRAAVDQVNVYFVLKGFGFVDSLIAFNKDQQQIIYVSKAGDDSKSGLNINDSKLTIQEAILDAILLVPSVTNQIVIEVIDAGDYTDAVNLPEWVHLKAPNASLDGILDISDNCIVEFRRLMRTTAGGSCIKKTTGTGFAKISVELLIVRDGGQNGLLANMGVIHIDAGVILVDGSGSYGIKTRNESRVSFIISEVELSNGAIAFGTSNVFDGANFISGNVLYVKDDDTCTAIESVVNGDVINIQGGSVLVNTLYNITATSTLNAFFNEATGIETSDPSATINVTRSGSKVDLTDYNNDISNPPYKEGRVFYDKDKNALSYYNDESETTVNIAQEQIVKVCNESGSIVLNGEAVRVSTSVNGLPCIIKSQADTAENARAVGVATHDISIGGTGYVTVFGSVGSVDTSSFSDGDILYVSATVAGELTNIEQQILSPVAIVLVSAVDGEISVKPQGVLNPVGIGQVLGDSEVQILTTTPQPLTAYNNTDDFTVNTIVTQTGTSPYTASMTPATIGASGYYRISFTFAILGVSNTIYNFELYINGIPTGLLGKIDLGNNNIDTGSTSLSVISPAIVSETDDIEIYGYVDSGTSTTIFETAIFSIERIGIN